MSFQCCRICGGNINFENKIYDDRYGYQGCFDLFKCRCCGHRFLNIEFSTDQLVRQYTDYYPRSTRDVSSYRPLQGAHGLNAWLSGAYRSAYLWVPHNVRILDIGCGFGESLGYHKARGCDVYGVEADENIRRVADKYSFNVHVGLFDPDRYEQNFFDYVTLDQVVEHVTDPLAVLRGVARVLKPGGMVVLSTPNPNGWGAKLFGRRWINWHAPYHLQHFSRASMRIAAEKSGLLIESVRTLTCSEWLHYQWIHVLTFPKLGEPSPFWSPNAGRTTWDKLVIGILSQVHRTRFNHIVTRLFDALYVGDNHIFFLRKP